jgi:hypothetical protein
MLASSESPDACENTFLPPDAAEAKKRQNAAFKRFGAVAWFFGVGGFLPTTLLGLYHGIPWSAASLEPHSDVDGWLYVHAFSMWLWCLAVAVQFWSGGRLQEHVKRVHRYSGYLGFGALSSGMLSGGLVYTVKYDFLVHKTFAGGYYTIVISVFAWMNMAVAIAKARQHQTAEHKDFVLMAFMWTMDPAVQRAAMHLLRCCLFRPDPLVLLTVGKLCGNVFLTLVFGGAAIAGRRENLTTVLNVAGQWSFGLIFAAAIMHGLSGADLDGRDLPLLNTVTITSGITLLCVGIGSLGCKVQSLRCWRPTVYHLAVFTVWAVLVGGFVVALLLPQGSATNPNAR